MFENYDILKYKLVTGRPEVVESEIEKLLNSEEIWKLISKPYKIKSYDNDKIELIVQPMVCIKLEK